MDSLARIGTEIDDTVLVTSLADGKMRAPLMDYKRYGKIDELSSGFAKGRGRPLPTWEFLYLTPAMVDELAVYCPDRVSSEVYIYTRTDEFLDEYKAFRAKMRWPLDESIKDLRREKLIFTFWDAIEVTLPGPSV